MRFIVGLYAANPVETDEWVVLNLCIIICPYTVDSIMLIIRNLVRVYLSVISFLIYYIND